MGRPDEPGGDGGGRAGPAPPAAPHTGVCLVRVQWEGRRLRYRVVLTPDISRPRAEQARECRDLDDAVLTVREFLLAFGEVRPR